MWDQCIRVIGTKRKFVSGSGFLYFCKYGIYRIQAVQFNMIHADNFVYIQVRF